MSSNNPVIQHEVIIVPWRVVARLSGPDEMVFFGLLERVGTGIVGTIGYVVLPTGVSTDVSRDII